MSPNPLTKANQAVILNTSFSVTNVGGCQNYDPFLGTLNIRCRIIIGIQKGTIISTTTHVPRKKACFPTLALVSLLPKGLGFCSRTLNPSPYTYLCIPVKPYIPLKKHIETNFKQKELGKLGILGLDTLRDNLGT